MEGYGIYLFFTETELYTEVLAQNGLFGFTTFFIIFNLALLVLAGWAGYKMKKMEKTLMVLLHFFYLIGNVENRK
nr:DUF5966 family protein [Streptococcus salivarius]